MTTALVMLHIERTKINQVAEKLASVEGITEVFSVSGNYDLVALLRVTNNDELAKVITEEIAKIDHIIKTETMIAFRVFSRFDLASMFEIGD